MSVLDSSTDQCVRLLCLMACRAIAENTRTSLIEEHELKTDLEKLIARQLVALKSSWKVDSR